MSFDIHKWNKRRYLAEAGLLESTAEQTATVINKAIETVDKNLSYKDFALAVAKILKDEYGSQNFSPFMEVLHSELGMKESLSEDEESLSDMFAKKFKVKVYSSGDSISFTSSEDISNETFEKMIKFVEDKGYDVNRDKSTNYYDDDGEKKVRPQIKFSKK